MDNIKESEFFNNFLNNTKTDEEIKKKLSAISSDSNCNSKTITIELKIDIPIEVFDVDFRLNLINWIKKKFESRSYYIFYINSIDYKPILNNELPLIKLIGDIYTMCIPLSMELFFFKKNDVVTLKLILKNNISENKINIFGQNQFISCKINLNNNQFIEAGYKNGELIKDNTYNKIYNNGDNIQVKIISFLNNQLENTFSPRINCEGILV